MFPLLIGVPQQRLQGWIDEAVKPLAKRDRRGPLCVTLEGIEEDFLKQIAEAQTAANAGFRLGIALDPAADAGAVAGVAARLALALRFGCCSRRRPRTPRLKEGLERFILVKETLQNLIHDSTPVRLCLTALFDKERVHVELILQRLSDADSLQLFHRISLKTQQWFGTRLSRHSPC